MMPPPRRRPEPSCITVERLRPTPAAIAALRWHDGPRRRVRQAVAVVAVSFVAGILVGGAAAAALAAVAWLWG